MAKVRKTKAMKTSSVATTADSTLLDELTRVRNIAMSAADLSVSVMREVTRIMRQNDNSQVKSIEIGIGRLLQDGYISTQEAKDLKKISRLVLGATRKKADPSQNASQVSQLYQRMVISDTGSRTIRLNAVITVAGKPAGKTLSPASDKPVTKVTTLPTSKPPVKEPTKQSGKIVFPRPTPNNTPPQPRRQPFHCL